MYCRNCGASNLENAKFCENCGKPLSKPVKRIVSPWVVGGVVLTLAIIGFLIILISSSSNGPTFTKTSYALTSTFSLQQTKASFSNQDNIPTSTLTPIHSNQDNNLITVTPPPITSTPAEPEKKTFPTQISGNERIDMIDIPAGDFWMGAQASDGDAREDEKPAHLVTLPEYLINKTDVTNSMFNQFVNETGYITDAEKNVHGNVISISSGDAPEIPGANWRHPRYSSDSIDGKNNFPVVQVSWNDASAYCKWAGGRLPTEAEWEKAARGTDNRIYPWGNNPPNGTLLNFSDRSLGSTYWMSDMKTDDGYQFASPVGNYPKGASPYGLLDMAGDVWEWVADIYSASYYSLSPKLNPQGPGGGTDKVLRGGSFVNGAKNVRSTRRNHNDQSEPGDEYGFRCVQDK
jgi:eukaryotic-like serine/threonine-protein kinase